MNYWFFLIPLFGALFGWCVNKIVVSLFFYPGRPKKIFGVTFHGFLPRRQEYLAGELGRYAETIFAGLKLEEKIGNPSNLQKAMPVIEGHVDDFLRNKLKDQMPMLTMFIGEKTIQTLKTVFLKELETLFPEVMKQFASSFQSEIAIDRLISEKLRQIPVAQIRKQLSKPISVFIWTGVATGFFIGLLQLLLLLLLLK
jgi:uncharacterized membrane protein YheB (UPF0754 family)